MGARTWMLVYSDGSPKQALAARPALNREASLALAAKLFPTQQLEPLGDVDLCYTRPPKGELTVGCFPGVAVIAAKEFGIDYPTKLPSRFLEPSLGSVVHLHAMHSVVDWCAFAVWENGKLRRSLSVSPDNGVWEDLGERFDFEQPYWAGKHPVGDPEDKKPYPLPFHPLDLSETALLEFFGFQYEGPEELSLVNPEQIPLLSLKRTKKRNSRPSPWWKFWS